MSVKKDILVRVYISFFLVVCLAGAIVFKICDTQIVHGAYWRSMADSLTTAYVNIEPIRGNIYATDGSLLATSIPIYEVHLDAAWNRTTKSGAINDTTWRVGLDSLSFCLAGYFKDKSPEQYKQELQSARKRKSHYYLIKRKLTHSQLKEIMKFPILRLGRYKGGLIVEQKSRRILPFQMAQRTIGYKTPDVKPVGLEGAYDKFLAGKMGKRLMQKVSGGVWIPINDDNELDPKDGQDIMTSIDVNMQDVTTNALMDALKLHGAHHGCAIVMEVSTGYIKAIANLTREEEDVYAEKYNYAIGESTEPGSTFKLASVMAMLDAGGINPNTMVDTKGGVTTFFDREMKDSKDGGYGVIPLKKAFAYSSNVAISTLAVQAFSKQPSKFTNYISKLGISKPLNISIFGEGMPVFKTPKNRDWNGTTLPWMSIGYELRITPLQTLTMYNAIANNGVMVKPQFVQEVREVGQLVRRFDPEVMNPEVCSKRTLKDVQAMLEMVVEEGTAKNIRNSLYSIAGKTGTAQVANELGGYKQQKLYQASFCGYFPASHPMYSIIVIINNPSKGAYYGASVAAPVFKEISDKIYANTATTRSYLSYFGEASNETMPLASVMLSSDLDEVMKYSPIKKPDQDTVALWVKPEPKANSINSKDYRFKNKTVPDVQGMVLADAMYILENMGLKVRFSGRGRVGMQSLNPGDKYEKGETISLLLN